MEYAREIARVYAMFSNRYLTESAKSAPERWRTTGVLRCLAAAYSAARRGEVGEAHALVHVGLNVMRGEAA